MTELLDLATVVDRDTVRIRTKKNPDGTVYDLIERDELGPYELQLIYNRYEKWQRLLLLSDRKLSPAEKREVSKALGDILKLLIPELESPTLAEMELVQRARIVAKWSEKYQDQGAAEGEAPTSPPPTTAGSSHGSRRSTGATPKRGSTPRSGS